MSMAVAHRQRRPRIDTMPPQGDRTSAQDAAAWLAALRLHSGAYVVLAADGSVIDHNEMATELLGLTRDELLGLTSLDPRWQAVDMDGVPVPSEDHPAMVTLRTRRPVIDFEMGARRTDQQLVWLRISSQLLDPNDPRSECVVVFSDVTHELARDRALDTVRAANRSLLTATDGPELMTNVCHALTEGGGYRLAWIGVASATEDDRVDVVARSGHSEYLFDGIVSSSEDEPRGRGPVGTTIRDRIPILVNDVDTDDTFVPWRESAHLHRFSGVATFPLTVDSRPAALSVYASVGQAFDDEALALLGGLVAQLEYGLANLERTERLHTSLQATVSTLATLAEARDPYTAGHQRRVAELSVAIGRELGLGQAMLDGLDLGALVHDIGKINIPAEILSKPGRLDEIEFELIKRHSELGARILADGMLPWPVPEIAAQHHERYDGTGYPNGLSGAAIALPARIVTVADVVEAVAHHRPYRPGLGIDAALDLIAKGAGTQFDPDVADACGRVFAHGFRFSSSDDPAAGR